MVFHSFCEMRRKGIDGKRTVDALRIGVHVVRDAVFADAALRALPAASEFPGAHPLQRFDEWRPVRTEAHSVGGEFVISRSVGQRNLQKVRDHILARR